MKVSGNDLFLLYKKGEIEMDDLIPSKQISDYLKEKNVEFTDFEKATLIFNNKFLSKDTKHQKLKEIAQKTENQELKKQIQERLQFEEEFYRLFLTNDNNQYMYTIEHDDHFYGCFKNIQEALDHIKQLSLKIGLHAYMYVATNRFTFRKNTPIGGVELNFQGEISTICSNFLTDYIEDCPERFEWHYVYIPTFFKIGECVRNIRTNEYAIVCTDDSDVRNLIKKANKRGWQLYFIETTCFGYILRDGIWYLEFLDLTELEYDQPRNHQIDRHYIRAYEAMSDYVHYNEMKDKISKEDLDKMIDIVIKTTKEYAMANKTILDSHCFNRVKNAEKLDDLIYDTI